MSNKNIDRYQQENLAVGPNKKKRIFISTNETQRITIGELGRWKKAKAFLAMPTLLENTMC